LYSTNKQIEIMTRQYQIQEYVNRNVFKAQDKLGNMVWQAIDLREGDTFNCDTYQEAVNIFVSNWDNLDNDEKNRA
jgi:hypothetical protein